jgi:hypothetical protein
LSTFSKLPRCRIAALIILIILDFALPTYAQSTPPGIARVAGIKVDGGLPYTDKVNSALSKIQHLLLQHPQTDLIVLDEDIFDLNRSQTRPVVIRFNSSSNDYTLDAKGNPASQVMMGFINQLKVIADVNHTNVVFVAWGNIIRIDLAFSCCRIPIYSKPCLS